LRYDIRRRARAARRERRSAQAEARSSAQSPDEVEWPAEGKPEANSALREQISEGAVELAGPLFELRHSRRDRLEPVYVSPQALVVVPDRARLGGECHRPLLDLPLDAHEPAQLQQRGIGG